MYLDHVGKDTFYGLLAFLRGQLFRDADFAEFYCAEKRTSGLTWRPAPAPVRRGRLPGISGPLEPGPAPGAKFTG